MRRVWIVRYVFITIAIWFSAQKDENCTKQNIVDLIENMKQKNRSRLRFILLFVASTIFMLVWALLNYLRLESFSEFIYNAGVNTSALIQMAIVIKTYLTIQTLRMSDDQVA